MLDGVGHMSTLEDPDAVNEHLVPFARSIVTRSYSVLRHRRDQLAQPRVRRVDVLALVPHHRHREAGQLERRRELT